MFKTNPGPFHFKKGSFRPLGQIHHQGPFRNPAEWEKNEVWSARLIVGFNVAGVATWDLEDLITLVRSVREAQVGDPSSTFLAQKGIYKHFDGTVVEEEGGQVIIFKLGGTPEDFEKQMVELAETIARQFQQETVILELQKDGVHQRLGYVKA